MNSRPIAATISVVIRNDRVLLVRRANPPDAGRWGFPGGKLEFGETIMACAERELFEETSVVADAQRVITAVEAFDRDDLGISQHFVLVAVLCRWSSGEPTAGDDALDARWVALDALETAGLALSVDVVEVALLAKALK